MHCELSHTHCTAFDACGVNQTQSDARHPVHPGSHEQPDAERIRCSLDSLTHAWMTHPVCPRLRSLRDGRRLWCVPGSLTLDAAPDASRVTKPDTQHDAPVIMLRNDGVASSVKTRVYSTRRCGNRTRRDVTKITSFCWTHSQKGWTQELVPQLLCALGNLISKMRHKYLCQCGAKWRVLSNFHFGSLFTVNTTRILLNGGSGEG